MEEIKKPKLTEEEKKEHRRQYMKKYYRRKNFQIDEDGSFYKAPVKPPKIPPIKIIKKETIISFN